MPAVPGLRSPYALVGRLVYFGRMLDKIRLHAAGALPAEYAANLGEPQPRLFDARCCRFLGVPYAELRAQVLAQGSTPADDEALLTWAHARGSARTDDECTVWNRFLMKLGWRDDRTAPLRERVAAAGLTARTVETFFDFLDYDEGRDPVLRRAWELLPAQAIVIMGAAGSGKTTIGAGLAASLGWSFRDADEFHPPANVAKMSAGTPLDDDDRAPWLAAIRTWIDTQRYRGESVVVTCSALKQTYRAALGLPGTAPAAEADAPAAAEPTRARLVFLHGSRELLLQRLAARQGHFMKPAMLDSQLATLEPPAASEALTLDVTRPPDVLLAEIRRAFAV